MGFVAVMPSPECNRRASHLAGEAGQRIFEYLKELRP